MGVESASRLERAVEVFGEEGRGAWTNSDRQHTPENFIFR